MSKENWSIQNQTLQSLLKKAREEAKLTQLELATLLKKPQSYVSKYENGEKRLDLIELQAIMKSCGTNLEKFVKNFELITQNME